MNTTNLPQGQWYTEDSFHQTFAQSYKVKRVLHSEQSSYQKIEVLDTQSVGKLLLLDGKCMISELDEFVYHECLAHVPMGVARSPKRVLIIGGGDGGVVREFVRHPELLQIDLVEIDERVIEVCKAHFPECTQGLDDPRVTVHCVDGLEFIKKHQNTYDIIVVDSTDPENFAEGLFQRDFYSLVSCALTEEGILVNQTENPFMDEYGIRKIYDNLKDVFPVVQSYWGAITIYPGCYWTFGFSSKKYKGTDLNVEKVPQLVEMQRNLKWYNVDWHLAAFSLSNYHKQKLGLQ